MLLENVEKRLKQEKKHKLKISVQHVFINATDFSLFALYFSVKDKYLRDTGCIDVRTNLWGCLTTPMEASEDIVTVSLDTKFPKDFQVWLLTRVVLDPSLFIGVHFHFCYSKHIVITTITITAKSEYISNKNPSDTTVHVCQDVFDLSANHLDFTSQILKIIFNRVTDLRHKIFIKRRKVSFFNLFFFCDQKSSIVNIHKCSCYQQPTDIFIRNYYGANGVKMTVGGETSSPVMLIQLSHIHISFIVLNYAIKSNSVIKRCLIYKLDHGFDSMLTSKSNYIRYTNRTYYSKIYRKNNDQNREHASENGLKIKPKLKKGSQVSVQNEPKKILLTDTVDTDYTADFYDKSPDSDSDFNKTNTIFVSFNFHVLLARVGGQVRQHAHLEVSVEALRCVLVNAVKVRNQVSEECNVWTLATSEATVVNDFDAVVADTADAVVNVNVSRTTIGHRWGTVSAPMAVVIVIAGTRVRTRTAGGWSAHWTLVNADKMGFYAMSGEQWNICQHTMISKHQLAGTTTCLTRRRRLYFDYLNNFNIKLSFNIKLLNYKYHINFTCKVTIYYLLRQFANIIHHFIALNRNRSHSAKLTSDNYSVFIEHFLIDFDFICKNFEVTYKYMCPIDTSVTDKGTLQNAKPDKIIPECFLSILSFFIKGSIRTRKNLNNITTTIEKTNWTYFDKITKPLSKNVTILNCYGTYYTSRLMHDVELNPGPVNGTNAKTLLTIVTLNCRGLGSIDKFRLILNKAHEFMTKGETIIMLQETMTVTDNYLKMAWRGNSVFTPGTGNSLGCITLTNATSNISLVNQIGHRGHYFTYSSSLISTAIIMNIYAPQGFDEAKTNFFIDNFNVISNYDCDVIIGGDLNVTLSPNDRHCRGVTNAELILAEEILEYQQALGLEDTWQGKKGYTWQKGQTMSKLDRILYRITNFKLKSNKVDWTLAKTDHAAVIAKFEHEINVTHKSSHVKLDNDILKDCAKLNELKEYLRSQLNDPQVATFNPHAKLEFAKMTIRTKALDIMARCRKQTNEELNELNRDIITNTRLLSSENDIRLKNLLVRDIERLKVHKDTILEAQGEKLASLAKTKWYNEGEKSNKYFLNMLKRQQSRSDMNCLVINGVECTDGGTIKEHVKDFYQQLYNHGRGTHIEPSFLDNMFTVDDDSNQNIKIDITLNELWLTLKSLKATTPGPDGISNTYLKKLFEIIGPLIIDAWQHSLLTNELMSSHKNSFLRLIPKPGKDTRDLKNWRPITLSNCDHKLITKTYNNRLLNIIKDYITPTQTAYIKGRNISDNLRLLNALTKNSAINQDVNVSAIALDAQKAFDSVNHEYLKKILERIGLTNFIPIFELLYKDLVNDIIINGNTGAKFNICNGVKQGDALSCSLFILAIEPVIRNIQANQEIIPVRCNRLNFTWPKVLAYADDITVLTRNNHHSVQAIFTEYEKLSQASGLFLNADKTELFNITSPHTFAMQQHHVQYVNNDYTIINSTSVKINGVIFNNDNEIMAQENFEHMFAKMNRHFCDWSKRNLSILGKIQIIKTFGLSQYLYSLAITDFLPVHWKEINKAIAKFIWNKHYVGNRAPNRISNAICNKPIEYGGFGMLDLKEVVTGLRLRRVATLLEKDHHPINRLQISLGVNDFLRQTPRVKIDPPSESTMAATAKHNLTCLENYDLDELEFDRLLRLKLCNTKIINIIGKQRRNDPLLARLRHLGVDSIHEALLLGDRAINILTRICVPQIRTTLVALFQLPHIEHGGQMPLNLHIYNMTFRKWENAAALKSSKIRQLLFEDKVLLNTKMLDLENEEAAMKLYKRIKGIKSMPLKTKILRLIHGDIYCGTRLVRFRLSDIDTCIRCFSQETREHLISHCPYTQQIWRNYGIINPTLRNILTSDISQAEFEIRSALLETIVFRKQHIPPEIVITTTMTRYAQGLVKNKRITDYAKMKLAVKSATGQWY
jgi:hypothetical protein